MSTFYLHDVASTHVNSPTSVFVFGKVVVELRGGLEPKGYHHSVETHVERT